jgi:hypothetical protein
MIHGGGGENLTSGGQAAAEKTEAGNLRVY